MWVLPRDGNERLALAVVMNMTEWNRREIFALRADEHGPGFLDDVMAAPGPAWIAGVGASPVAVFGTAPLWPGVWSLWFFATPSLQKILLSVTRHIVGEVLPALWQGGAHRLECRLMEGNAAAAKWFGQLGGQREGTSPRYGKGGETFHAYRWDRP